jgi:hypothetical protein
MKSGSPRARRLQRCSRNLSRRRFISVRPLSKYEATGGYVHTFHKLPCLFIDVAPLALYRHHAFDLGNIFCRAMLLLEGLPYL